MIPRKKRIAILITIITIIILLAIGGVAFLYIKTDALKPNEKLFAKYLMQNFNAIDNLIMEQTDTINNTLNTNKYTSKITGKVEYVDNINTSDENKNNPVNEMNVQINAQTDKSNNYYYKDIKVAKNDQNLIGVEYLNQDQEYGLRLDGIKQFVSLDTSNLNTIEKELNIENAEGIFQKIDFNEILTFSEEEKQTLTNTYLNVLKNNISKDKYYKQAQNLITVNNKDVYTNAYYIKLTREEYNNLKIKMLEQLAQDEIILAKIDKIEETIKEKYNSFDEDKSLKEEFKENIEDEIKDIQDNNIGNDEVKITVYESKGKTVRTSIEMNTDKLNIDIYNNVIKIENTILGETENKKIFQIERSTTDTEQNMILQYEDVTDNEITVEFKMSNQKQMNNNEITDASNIEISNNNCKLSVKITNAIKIVNEFDKKMDFENDNVNLKDLDENQVQTITNILLGNAQEQIQKFNENIPLDNFIKILQNLNVIKKDTIQISDKATVTETEKVRFNSQFEFFASQNLTNDNIKDLISTAEDKLADVKVVLQNGQEEDLDITQLEGNSSRDYISSIKEIDLKIKENQTNESKKQSLLKFLEKDSEKYDVTLEYNEQTGLVENIKITIKKD